ncbi:hypothetical protein CYLTODRAFT_368968 [Cylindrobasidium torrendii FP15055 ss-10]|uniref:Coatomer subunit epsilon n=1 Tax=Cylindrobasidium torrendii FP15055 ss-10 TaxID=1314674 RepID=A0A0D7BN58_9AGAR|nr:hypothetical protein CYLTODRAFT_368968 [Cylindrobasidium torrendii FP15055 ss-10]
MDSSELYHTKQLFVLGAYKAVVAQPLPDANSPDYTSALLYQIRSYIALDDTDTALGLIPDGTENVALKAASALARFVAADEDDREPILEELRDLSLALDDDVEGTEREKDLVRVLAGIAFSRAGETEEALETLGSETEDLEAVAVLVQIYLSIHRPDLAKKEFERSKRWAEDDLLLQLIESSIALVTGVDNYNDPLSFYSEQIGNPSLSSTHLLTSRAVTRILRGEVDAAKSDLEESRREHDDEEALGAALVVSGLSGFRAEQDELWEKFVSTYSTHPLAADVAEKADLFDSALANYSVPALPVVA